MTRPKLYLMEGSVPVRAVLITAAAIGLDLEKEYLNILKGDQFKPEYLKVITKFEKVYYNHIPMNKKVLICF